jgi:hypothetical protein
MGMTYIIAGYRFLSADFTFASHITLSLQGKTSGAAADRSLIYLQDAKKTIPSIRNGKRLYNASHCSWQDFYPLFVDPADSVDFQKEGTVIGTAPLLLMPAPRAHFCSTAKGRRFNRAKKLPDAAASVPIVAAGEFFTR